MNAKMRHELFTDEGRKKLDELVALRIQCEKLHDELIRMNSKVSDDAVSLALIAFVVLAVIDVVYLSWVQPGGGVVLIMIIAVFVVSFLVHEFILKFHPANKHSAVIQKQRHKLRKQLGALKREILEN